MTSTPMVETIAMAIYRAHGEAIPEPLRNIMFGDPLAPWEEIAEPIKRRFRAQALAALSALSTPTEGMVEAGAKEDEPELWVPAPGHNQGECVYCDDRRQAKLFEAKQRFVAMIQAALSEGNA